MQVLYMKDTNYNIKFNKVDMKKSLIAILSVLLCSLSVAAQPYVGGLRHRPHHTNRLPGINERRLARLEKMRNANLQLRHVSGPLRAKTQPETKRGLVLLDVVGPLTLTKKHDYYGTAPNYQLDDRAPEMVIEALKLANADVNYADYDWDNDGEVDQVYVIYAGVTEYGKSGYIWPHEWNLSAGQYYGSGSGTQRLDGVNIDTYAVSNELASRGVLNGIGTACHEFSHCLGYPDFYDSEYNGGTAGQNWDVMDGGSYNGPRQIGEVPSPYTAHQGVRHACHQRGGRGIHY